MVLSGLLASMIDNGIYEDKPHTPDPQSNLTFGSGQAHFVPAYVFHSG